MIPYFSWSVVQLGPLTLHVWGFFVALGIWAGTLVTQQFAKRRGLQTELLLDTVFWTITGGLIGARLGYVLFYNFADYIRAPWNVFAVWDGGMSMMGAFVGAVAMAIWFLRRRQADILQYTEAMVFGLPFGYAVGRIGCFLIHDHPGTATHFFLGVKYPDGVVRHDLGLYLSLTGLAIGAVFLALSRRERPVGTYAGTFLVLYGAARLWLDMYRIADTRYFGLTPGQYFGVLFIVIGAAVIYTIKKTPGGALKYPAK